MTRSVRDTAALLDVVRGSDAGRSVRGAAARRSPFASVAAPPARPLRVGFRRDAPRGIEVDAECAAAVATTARAARAARPRVEEAHPEALDDPAAREPLRRHRRRQRRARARRLGREPRPPLVPRRTSSRSPGRSPRAAARSAPRPPRQPRVRARLRPPPRRLVGERLRPAAHADAGGACRRPSAGSRRRPTSRCAPSCAPPRTASSPSPSTSRASPRSRCRPAPRGRGSRSGSS